MLKMPKGGIDPELLKSFRGALNKTSLGVFWGVFGHNLGVLRGKTII